jgi:putative hydrolase of the HAD superfamily
MNDYPTPTAVLFDLDDTLILYGGVALKAWDKSCQDFLANHEVAFTKEELLAVVEKVHNWYWNDPTMHKTGRLNLLDARREIAELSLFEFNIYDAKMSKSLADSYSFHRKELMCLFPKTIATLTELRSRGIRMGLVTNGTAAAQREKLARFGLEEFFEIILIEQEVGYGKPDIRIYELALELLGLSAADVWMVGDDLVGDVQAPQSMGIFSIWNDYKKTGLPPTSDAMPDRIVSDVSSLFAEG